MANVPMFDTVTLPVEASVPPDISTVPIETEVPPVNVLLPVSTRVPFAPDG